MSWEEEIRTVQETEKPSAHSLHISIGIRSIPHVHYDVSVSDGSRGNDEAGAPRNAEHAQLLHVRGLHGQLYRDRDRSGS